MPTLAFDGTFDGWRAAARVALGAGLAPNEAVWRPANDLQHGLALDRARDAAMPAASPVQATVPRRFLAIGALVACHREPERWATLYRVLWRMTRHTDAQPAEPHLLAVAVDPDVLQLTRMAKAVKREVHKMHAFVRFRRVQAADGVDEYIAWFEPEHDVVEHGAALFVRRFANMRWAVLTPRTSVRWDGSALSVGPGVPRQDAPAGDALERLWGTYYAHIFNPARVKLDAMRAEMPKRYWRNLPEAPLIAPMVRDAPARVRRMIEAAAPRAPRRTAVITDSVVEDVAVDGIAVDDGVGHPVVDPSATAHVTTHATARAVAPERIGDALVYVGSAAWEHDDTADASATPDGSAADAAARMRQYASRFPLAVVTSTRERVLSPALAALWAERAPAGLLYDVHVHAGMVGGAVRPHRLPRAIRDLLPPSLAGAERVDGALVPAALHDALWARFLDAAAVLADRGALGAVLLQLPSGFGPDRETAARLRGWLAALGAWRVGVAFADPGWDAPRVRARTRDLLGGAVVVRAPGEATDDGELAIVRAGPRAWIEQVAERSRTVHVLG